MRGPGTSTAFSCLIVLSFLACASRADASSARAVAAGVENTCVVTSTGGVKCWGDNSYGEVGDGTTVNRVTPTDVTGLGSGVAAVALGEYHACALTTAGGVKCWGSNSSGQLGDGTVANRSTPVGVSGLASGVAAVAAGYSHTCALTTGGGVKCWGWNAYGQVGDGSTTGRTTPVDVPGLATGVSAIAAGSTHTCVVTAGGGVKCWGGNWFGTLGDGTTIARTTPVGVSGLASGATSIAAGLYHTCAVVTGGAVMCWGENGSGAVGDGSTTDRLTPVGVASLAAGAVTVVAGGTHTCAMLTGGALKCWGGNQSGQVGDGTSTAARTTPVDVSGLTTAISALSAGESHTCIVTAGGGVKCWGSNWKGQVGYGGGIGRSTPGDVPGLGSGIVALAAGYWDTCALGAGGGLACWGLNSGGQLGDGTTIDRTTPTQVSGLASGVAALAVGGYHACALTTGGGVKCWGQNTWGALGDGSGISRSTPVDVSGLASGVAALAAGSLHTCALSSSGGVKCWGRNDLGQLGDGSATDRSTPVDVPGLTTGVAGITAGHDHTCALTTGGALKCWGDNAFGQLGDGTTTRRMTPTQVSGLASGVAAVAAGGVGYHTCALTTGGGLECWGWNPYGQVGDGSFGAPRTTPTPVSGLTTGVAAVALGYSDTCAVTTAGGLACWGGNDDAQLGDGTTTARATPTVVPGLGSGVAVVGAGLNHTCAVTTGGAVKCWGAGANGQLGDSRYGTRPRPTRAMGFGRADFDGDDRVDAAVYRPSTGTWFSLDSSSGNTTYRYRGWGDQAHNDVPVVGDYDGDGIDDPTVFRPGTGTWFVLRSDANYTTWDWFGWGNSTDVLVPGDYDGDGLTDAAIYRPSEGKWYVRPSSGAPWWSVAFGNATDTPIAGDFDGDGKRDPALYRASTGTWFWLKSSTNFTAYDYKGWGISAQADTPAPGDYDGDGKTDLCVFRPAGGTWFVLESHTNYASMTYFGWGVSGDTLVPADYDGDGRTDRAVYRASTGTWYIKPSSGATEWNKVFGQAGDLPLR